MKYIGIDTGTNTGFAVWDTRKRQFETIETLKIHDAMRRVVDMAQEDRLFVRFEDARQRKWIPDTHSLSREMGRRQGAGSVKRDSTIWDDFLNDYGIPYEAVAPARNRTKLDADAFTRVTRWDKRTDEHGRDAAMLVFGMNNLIINR